MKVVTIGRPPGNNTIQLEGDMQVSRNHAQLTNNNGQYFITDLNSTNGTFVNGQMVRGTKQLQTRDVVRLGNTTIPWLMYFDDNYVSHLNSQRSKPANNANSPTPHNGGGGVYVIPGQTMQGGNNSSNGMAVAGFILSFFIAPLGLIFSSIGLSKANKIPGNNGRGLAVAGLVLSIIGCLILLLIIIGS